MPRRPTAPPPQAPNLTIEEMKLGVTRLKRRIADLEAFAPQSVQKRWAPEVKALEASIDQSLADVFGHKTVQYNRYRGAAKLDHGHDGEVRESVARFISEKLSLQPIILHERPNKGRTIITKFQEESAGAGFAVVLMTPDDFGKARDAADLNPRARQNVVFELGFFIGALGPANVAALVEGDIELPSDFDGVVYISLEKEDWRTKLGQELEAAGYAIDWNKVMRK